MSSTQELRQYVRAHAENRPGIYRMRGPGGEMLYVGKSIRVRTRLLSYFRATRGEKAAEIIAHTHSIDWEYVPSEFASLLAELREIKRWRPIYNVEHKRDRQYCFIKLTRDRAPRLLVVGDAALDGGIYFGPFRGRTRVREAIRELADLLELRDCAGSIPIKYADQPDLFGHVDSPRCIRAELRRCLAPCAGHCTRAEYFERVELALRFLEGDADRPLAILAERMRLAAERLQFEYAATLRDRAARLDAVRQELIALRDSVGGLTFLYPVAGHGGDDRLYLIHRGAILAEFAGLASPADREAAVARCRVLIEQAATSPPHVHPTKVPEILLVARWFRLRPEERAKTLPIDALAELRPSA